MVFTSPEGHVACTGEEAGSLGHEFGFDLVSPWAPSPVEGYAFEKALQNRKFAKGLCETDVLVR